jgi:hypothetical protein
MTPTEKFIADLCEDTFLSFWSFPNPIGKKLDKELCDVLVICDPDIIIFSVKEINIKDSGNYEVDAERWERNAIDESVKQIYGAERILRQKEEVLLKDKSTKIKLPSKEIRNIYRVAVAFGRGEKFSMKTGDFGKGFVHCFDERSVQIILQELDTISDFIDFLKAKEEFTSRGIRQIAFSSEDYLAMYLHNGFDIPEGVDLIQIDSEYWTDYSKSKEYQEEQKLNKISYLWDELIQTLYYDFKDNTLINEVGRDELEMALRHMNRENRFGRRQMSQSLIEVIGDEKTKPSIKARIIYSTLEGSNIIYVFMTRPNNDRDFGVKELHLRCLVARSLFKDRSIVIGIGIDPYNKGKGFSKDLLYMDLTNWTEEQNKEADIIKEELGYFRTPKTHILKPDGKKHYH